MLPTHAFVVPAYGESPFLGACLDSLKSQSVPSEVTITTSTPSAYIETAARSAGARLIVNETAAGIASDWNFALLATTARRVTLAHQDDVYFPRFLEETLRLLDAFPDAALCFTGYAEIDDTGAVTSSRISGVKQFLEAVMLGRTHRPSRARLRGFLSFGNPLPCSSVTFDRRRLVGFAFDGAYRSNLDWDAWWRLLTEGRTFVRTPERLIGRRHNNLTETARLIDSGVRRAEDLAMFRRRWPRPLAAAIALLYGAGYQRTS